MTCFACNNELPFHWESRNKHPIISKARDSVYAIGTALFNGATLGSAGAPVGIVTTLIGYNLGVLEAVARQFGSLMRAYTELDRLATKVGIVAAHTLLTEGLEKVVEVLFPESIFGLNRYDTGTTLLTTPLLDELAFRGGIQDLLLTRIPKLVLKKIAPGQESLLDSKVYKAAKIILTSALFALRQTVHFEVNGPLIGSVFVVYAFTAGVALGVMKESKPGILGCVTAYSVHNLVKHSIVTLFHSAQFS